MCQVPDPLQDFGAGKQEVSTAQGSHRLQANDCRLDGVVALGPFACKRGGGDDRDRTDDPLLAKQVLSQLSYAPTLVNPLGLKQEIQRSHPLAHHLAANTTDPRSCRQDHLVIKKEGPYWWAREDLNLRPHAYQACALTS
jgi:hypothetical protein